MVGVGAVVGVATDVVVEEAITTPHKPMTMPTSEEQEYGQVLLLWKIWALCGRVSQEEVR